MTSESVRTQIIGAAGEVLITYKLLKFGIDSARMTTDAGGGPCECIYPATGKRRRFRSRRIGLRCPLAVKGLFVNASARVVGG